MEGNPCIAYLSLIIFPWFGSFEVLRSDANGGNKVYASLEELCEDYTSGGLHPGDLKPALALHINKILQPVRDHFVNDPHAAELLKKVKVCGGGCVPHSGLYMTTHVCSSHILTPPS